MHFIFPYFIILIVMLQFILRKNSRKNDNANEAYWKRERQSNTVRKKDISQLDYVTIPDDFPYTDSSDLEIILHQNNIKELAGKKILNLTGLSNTDLKLEYGAGNLEFLSECDDNFTTLCREIVSLGKCLLDSDYYVEGIRVLEFGIECGSDITANYTMLRDCYLNVQEASRLAWLKNNARKLNSINSSVILSKLDDSSGRD